MPKETIYLNSKKFYIAIKSACDIVPNLGSIEKLPQGNCDGTLNAKLELMQEISAAGGNFIGASGYTRAINGKTRRVDGSGFEGWRQLGSIDNAIAYLQQYFDVQFCNGVTCLDIELSRGGWFVADVDDGLGVRVHGKNDRDEKHRQTKVVVTKIAPKDNTPVCIDDYFRRLQEKMEGILTNGVISEIYFPGGGTTPIPEWFKAWCRAKGIELQTFDP